MLLAFTAFRVISFFKPLSKRANYLTYINAIRTRSMDHCVQCFLVGTQYLRSKGVSRSFYFPSRYRAVGCAFQDKVESMRKKAVLG